MLVVAWTALWQLRRRGEPGSLLCRVLVLMTFSGWLALAAGWYVTEIGRQPWLVYGVLRTANAVTDAPAGRVGLTLVMYLLLYAVLLVAFVSALFHMARKAGTSPQATTMNAVADPFRGDDKQSGVDNHA